MKTYNRICIREQIFVDGDKTITLHRGQEYITSEVKDDSVVVFSTYWFKAPADLFAGEIVFTK